ncbi:MAG: helix-turn-helix transcriptional regulator [Phycisphaeraceae bacterium]
MTPPLRLATEGIIEALVFAARLKPHAKQSETLADKVIDFVYARSEQQITIAELADEMGYSPGYLSAMFRKQQGEPLKAFLDRIRGENAAHHLCYADLNITQIAQRMGFPDVYSFSRFCKRVLGESPKQLQGRRPPNT